MSALGLRVLECTSQVEGRRPTRGVAFRRVRCCTVIISVNSIVELPRRAKRNHTAANPTAAGVQVKPDT